MLPRYCHKPGEQKGATIKKGRKLGRNKVKCENYRRRVGKPNGRGMPGNKAGKNHVRVAR